MKISHPFSKITIFLTSVFFLVNCSGEAPKPQQSSVSAEQKSQMTQSSELTELYAEAGKTLFIARPLDATSAGVPVSLVGADINSQMTNYDPDSESALRNQLADLNNKIDAISESGLSSKEIENKKVMESVIRYFSGDPSFNIGYVDIWMGLSPFILNQINGPILDAPRALTDAHQVNNTGDAENYIVRLQQLGYLINGVQQKFIADAKQSWQPPKEVLEGAISHLQSFSNKPASSHGLVTSFADKLAKLDELSLEQKQDFVTKAEKALEQNVYPAYAALAETAIKWLPKSTTESGIWAQPNGAAYYQDAILQLGDSELSADEIHQIGLAEVARITAQMNSILKEQGYESGSVGERMVALSKEPRFLYEDSEAGRAKLISDVNGFIVDMTEKMAPLFKTKPKYKVEVRSFPKETQDSMPGGQYSPPPLDGSIPGIYWINLRDMEAVASFTLKTLTYHEANPGHHWQISIALEQTELPFLRLIAPYNAFIEGWALYSEQVAYELGMLSICTLMAPPICGLMEPPKYALFTLKQVDY